MEKEVFTKKIEFNLPLDLASIFEKLFSNYVQYAPGATKEEVFAYMLSATFEVAQIKQKQGATNVDTK